MILNKLIREAVIARVMSDVPEIDYMTMATDKIAKLVAEVTPPEIKKLRDDPKMYQWLDGGTSVHVRGLGYISAHVPNKSEFTDSIREA